MSGFLGFLLDVRERYCCGVTCRERREAQEGIEGLGQNGEGLGEEVVSVGLIWE